MADLKILYVTCSDIDEAKKIAKGLLEKKLVACANMFPIASMFFWKGKMNDDSETVLLLKTKEEKTAETIEEIKKFHSYSIPCILQLDAKSNPEFARWVDEQIK